MSHLLRGMIMVPSTSVNGRISRSKMGTRNLSQNLLEKVNTQ